MLVTTYNTGSVTIFKLVYMHALHPNDTAGVVVLYIQGKILHLRFAFQSFSSLCTVW